MEMRQGGMIPSARIHFVRQGAQEADYLNVGATEIVPMPYSTSYISSIDKYMSLDIIILQFSSISASVPSPTSIYLRIRTRQLIEILCTNRILYFEGKARPLETRVHNLQGIYRDHDTPP